MAETSNITAPTQFVETKLEKYAYRRFGSGPGLPLLCLQHFTGTLDNWDPAVTDPLASGREVILFESAGIGRSTGEVPASIPGMASHALAFTDALGLTQVDVLGYSLGGMVAQEIALERPSLVRKMLLVGTAPEGGEDIMHMEKPELKKITDVNGVFDNMIPVRNSYMLSEHLPNATLLTYPDAGHGSLFQFHDSFVRQASLFLGEKLWPA
jgi:pimeloyl-ACP methyl ester carboxylesterase